MAKAIYRVCTLPGDGIGPEIMAEGKKLSLIHISEPTRPY